MAADTGGDMDQAQPLVTIRGLQADARTPAGFAHLLRGIDLEIGRGRIVGIVGESGSGKSTLASALLGLMAGNVEPLRGSIAFDGTELLGLSPEEMARWRGSRIAMIFQDPMTSLNPLFTVGTHLADVLGRRFPGLGRDEIRRRSAAMLARVGMSDAPARLASYPHQLSGGMRQRVVIAMALLVRPDLLIADEPTTALDATVEAQIVALFAELKSELSGSVLFISHHLGLVAEFCDDLCVMYGGHVVERGPVDLVLSRPRHPYTRALLDCEIEDGSEGRLTTIPGEVPDALADVGGCIFAGRCTSAIDACRAAPPPMTAFGDGRAAACIRSTEVLP